MSHVKQWPVPLFRRKASIEQARERERRPRGLSPAFFPAVPHPTRAMSKCWWWYQSLLVLSVWHGSGAFLQPSPQLPLHPGQLPAPGVVHAPVNHQQKVGSTSTHLSVAAPQSPSDKDEPLRDASSRLQARSEDDTEEEASDHPQASPATSWTAEIAESLRQTFLQLTRLSLRDYEWRSSAFRASEADRLMEQSLARLAGRPENPSYVRPMDAADETIGPLGRWERSVVNWLARVIDEEGRRAQTILERQGQLVRPMEVGNRPDQDFDDEEEGLGPLGYIEKQVSDFIQLIRQSERARVETKTLQPKDLPAELRGPLGTLEEAVSRFWRELRESELMRAKLQAQRPDLVRPIDVPGPLGEWEYKLAAILQAEERRAMELERNRSSSSSTVLRPKDASYPGPLGELEQSLYDWLDSLRIEENERLRSIKRLMEDNRPMEQNRNSVLGFAEALVVGILRAPQLIASVFQRVQELLQSEVLEEDFLEEEETSSSSSSTRNKPSSKQ